VLDFEKTWVLFMVDFDPTQYLMRKQSSSMKLLHSTESSKEEDSLIAIASQRNLDTIKITNFMIKQRLTEEMNQTINTFLQENKELGKNYYLAFISDEDYTTEVLPIDTVLNAVQDTPKEEARHLLSSHSMGYFKRADFTLKTPEGGVHEKFKTTMDSFMKDHASIINYLRQNMDNIMQAEDLVN
jgi:hypothetical protein